MIQREPIRSIAFRDITINHGPRPILAQCSFDFPTNSNCRVIFQNEVEKFFFFNSLSGIKGFTAGEFLMNDQNILEFSFEEFLKFRKNMGFGFSTRGLLHNRSLRDNVILPLTYHMEMPLEEAEEWVEYLFTYFRAQDYMHRRPSEVVPSTQKVALILRSIAMRPEWLILDCPEIFLARKLQANLLLLIDDHRKHFGLKHLFYSTNDEELSSCLADTTLILEKQQIRVLNTLPKAFEAAA